ncbi:hypothetical protein AB0L49_50310 [Streptomyces antimycoticus]|uniref:hypothetical protein n=1 Tax=Streptomyces TaxID=1883 RepID=UPI003446F239
MTFATLRLRIKVTWEADPRAAALVATLKQVESARADGEPSTAPNSFSLSAPTPASNTDSWWSAPRLSRPGRDAIMTVFDTDGTSTYTAR